MIRKVRNQDLYEVKFYVKTRKEAKQAVAMHSMTGGMEQPVEDDEDLGFQQATVAEAIEQIPAHQAIESIQTPRPALQAEDLQATADFFGVLLREYPPDIEGNRRQAELEIERVFGMELPEIVSNTFYHFWG